MFPIKLYAYSFRKMTKADLSNPLMIVLITLHLAIVDYTGCPKSPDVVLRGHMSETSVTPEMSIISIFG
jgi:hypothetical protein